MEIYSNEQNQSKYFVENEKDYCYWLSSFTNQLSLSQKIVRNIHVAKKRGNCFVELIKVLENYYQNNQKCCIVKKEGCFYCPYDIILC